MRTDFLPRKDEDLKVWAANMAEKLAADAPGYGVPEAMADEFIARQQAFAAAVAGVANRGTRTMVAVSIKNEARRALEMVARQVAALVRATPGVSDVQRIELGIRVRKQGLTRTAKPSSRPRVQIVSAVGNTIEIELIDGENGRCAKPAGVAGATIYTFVGSQPPADKELWQCRGNVTRCRAAVQFAGSTPPGSRVWCMASWHNPRGEQGPTANAVCTNLPGGAMFLTTTMLAA